MKKITNLLLCMLMSSVLMAQYSTPGNGKSYSLNDLVGLSGGVVSDAFLINANLTISYPDTLLIETDEQILMAEGVLIDVQGALICNPPHLLSFTTSAEDVFFEGIDINDENKEDNESHSYFRNTLIERSGGVAVKYSCNLKFEFCQFMNNNHANASGALSCYHAAPIVVYCHFSNNEYPAISSGANTSSAPKIMYSEFINNVTANVNRPQINLGAANDDLVYIFGNRIEGNSNLDKVGGISIATMAGGSIEAEIVGNEIVNNRYGVNVFGGNIDAIIRNNNIIDNNIETNPMQGGSGVSCYGDESNNALIIGNRISGNLWGVTVINNAMPTLGISDEDTGNNYIVGNGHGGAIYELYNNTSNNFMAQYNYWGGDAAVAEAGIYHQTDDVSLGMVEYLPLLAQAPNFDAELSYFALQAGELVFNGDIQEDNTIVFMLPPDIDISNIAFEFGISEGAVALFEGEELISGEAGLNLTEPMLLSSYFCLDVLPACGKGVHYLVDIQQGDALVDMVPKHFNIYPNPTQNIISWNIEADINIYDMSGSLIMNKNNCSSLNIAHLPAAVYMAQLQTQEGSYMQKMVKQ